MEEHPSRFTKVAEIAKAKRAQLDKNTAARKANRLKAEEEDQLAGRSRDSTSALNVTISGHSAAIDELLPVKIKHIL
jgi:hypothetical protein